ncbi:hypothetical protein ABIB82_006935 [Bradyrhizobium sp. i1.8.4]|uniref:hypothetical protein n=1 Tax=unclassified Bradyrhizobium TaxID=2631580 RepID=UPI003D23C87F
MIASIQITLSDIEDLLKLRDLASQEFASRYGDVGRGAIAPAWMFNMAAPGPP